MNIIPTDAEIHAWLVLLVLAVVAVIAFFIYARIADNNEIKRMFKHCERIEYHDDMEDVWD